MRSRIRPELPISMLLMFLWLPVNAMFCQHSSTLSEQDIQSGIRAAIAAQDRGDLSQAESILTSLHKAHPVVFAINESLGLLLATEGKMERALPFLELAVREQSQSDAAHANLGAALFQLHRNQAALAEFEHAVHLNPANASSQQSLGRLLMDEHKPNEAAKALQMALRSSPGDSDLAMDCVTALLAAKRVDEARAILSGFAGAEQSPRAQSLLGEADEQQGKFEDAARHFQAALQLDPSEENAWLLGEEFLRHWTFEAAEKLFEAASAKFPDSQRLLLGLGTAYLGDAKYPLAISVLGKLLQQNPDNAAYAKLVGLSCNSLNESYPLCSELVKYAQSHPKDALIATYAASVLIKQSDDPQSLILAEKMLERAIALNPALADAHFEMGVLLQNSRKWQQSAPFLERAIRLRPDFTQAHFRLARAYKEMGRKNDAQTEFELYKKCEGQEEANSDKKRAEVEKFIVQIN